MAKLIYISFCSGSRANLDDALVADRLRQLEQLPPRRRGGCAAGARIGGSGVGYGGQPQPLHAVVGDSLAKALQQERVPVRYAIIIYRTQCVPTLV